MEAIKKFVIIGPESTGKSTLCSQLASHYGTRWVPEYAREYLEKNGTEYNFDTLLIIAKGQIALENAGTVQIKNSASNKIFIDTDMYVMKVWCEYVFHKCHNWILNQIAERQYDGYLLCNVDLPWVKDELREYPDMETRNKLYHFYKDLLINQSVPWIDVSGNYDERISKAIKFVNQI
ncbi:MAG: ATP-binding protein [Bacteroidota bacterium]|nr:ATP-binding protein [Bacteroidota bacterium]